MKKIIRSVFVILIDLSLQGNLLLAGGIGIDPDKSSFSGGALTSPRTFDQIESLEEKTEQQVTPIFLKYAIDGGYSHSPGKGAIDPFSLDDSISLLVIFDQFEHIAEKIQNEAVEQFQVLAVEYETFATIQEDLVKLGLFNDSIVQEDDYILIFDNQPEGAPSKATLLLPRISH